MCLLKWFLVVLMAFFQHFRIAFIYLFLPLFSFAMTGLSSSGYVIETRCTLKNKNNYPAKTFTKQNWMSAHFHTKFVLYQSECGPKVYTNPPPGLSSFIHLLPFNPVGDYGREGSCQLLNSSFKSMLS